MAGRIATQRSTPLQPHHTVRPLLLPSSSFFFHILLVFLFFFILFSSTVPAKAADTTFIINHNNSDSSDSHNTSVLPSPIRSLSGAVHLVVAAGSVGIYHVDLTDLYTPSLSSSHHYSNQTKTNDKEENDESSEKESAAKLLDGALLYFAPVSPYYFFLTMPELAEHAAEGGDGAAAASVWWPYAWSDERGYAPCEGYKKQDRIAPIEKSYVTVRHARRAEAGLICFSYDGLHYSPTGMTYEVLDITVNALLPITHKKNYYDSSITNEQEEDEDEEENENVRTHKELRVLRRSSGVWQLLLSHADNTSTLSALDSDSDVTSRGVVSSIRLASSAHCMRPVATLAAQDLPVTPLPTSAFTKTHWHFTTFSEEEAGSFSSSSRSDGGGGVRMNESVWAVVYHNADVIRFPSHTDRDDDDNNRRSEEAEEEVASANTFYVCLAVTKSTEDIARRYPVLHCNETEANNYTTNTTTTHNNNSTYSMSNSAEDHDRREGILVTSYPSSQEATYVMEDVIRHRLCARGSLAHSCVQPMTVYTLLPALRVVLQEPPVAVRGFWLLAPQSPLTLRRSVYLVAASAGYADTHYRLCETHGKGRRDSQILCTSASASSSAATGSKTTLRVTQYSSPVLVFDGEGLETGMLLSLTRTPGQCSNTNYKTSEAEQRLHDMAVPLSSVWLNVLQDEGDEVVMTRRKMYMAQLDLRHTAMSDTTSTTRTRDNNNVEEETWYVCFSYSTMSPQFVALRGLRLIVRPLRVWGLTAFEPGAGLPAAPPRALYADTNNEEANAEARTHVRVPIGWRGMLMVWGMDLSYWSQETFDHSVITLVPDNNNRKSSSSDTRGAATNESMQTHYMRLVRPLQDSLQPQPQQQPLYNTHNITSTSSNTLHRSGYGWYAPHVVLVPSSSFSSSSSAATSDSDMFARPTAQPLRLSLTVPSVYSDSKARDVMLPRTVLNDVRVSIELPSVTAIGTRTHEAHATHTNEQKGEAAVQTITLAEESDDVVLPVYGDRLHTTVALLFLMRPDATLCNSLASAHPFQQHDANNDTRNAWEYRTVDELRAQSLARIRLIPPYDLPARYHTRTSSSYTYNNVYTNNSDASASDDDEDKSIRAQIAAQPSPAMYMFLPRAQFTTRRAADALFGRADSDDGGSRNASDSSPAGRTARSLCLFIPTISKGKDEEESEGRGMVLPIPFQLVVAAPVVRRMANVPADAALVQHALRAISRPPLFRTHTPNPNEERMKEHEEDENSAFVVYGAHMDLLVTGIGLVESETELVPAQDCGNPHTFLFPVPLRASAWPSLRRDGRFAAATSAAERIVDSSESLVSWFVTLTTWHTTQLPRTYNSSNVQSGQILGRGGTEKGWVWCVHYRDAMKESNHTLPHAFHDEEEEEKKGNVSTSSSLHVPSLVQKRFVSTGLPYKLVIPAIEEIRVRFPSNLVDRTVHLSENKRNTNNSTSEVVVRLPVQDRTLGEWAAVELRGPLVELTFAAGYALNALLVERDTRCAQVHMSAAASSPLYVVNDSTVLLPHLLATPGQYKFCARLHFPPTAHDMKNSAYFELQQISLDIVPATYTITALNRISAQAQPSVLTLEHGEQVVWPVEGTWLSVRTRLRLVLYGALCHRAPAWPDLPLHTMPPTTTTLTQQYRTNTTNNEEEDEGRRRLYVTLEQNYLRLLSAPGLYQLCLKPHRAQAWRLAEQYVLQLRPHTRRPTHYDYFAHNGSEDVAVMTAVGPTRLTKETTTMTNASHTDTSYNNNYTAVVVDIVAPAATTTQLRLWCKTNVQHDDVRGGVSLCPAHRRVMFVKPLASHSDPCFVDAKAVSALVQRGPYVIEADGLLTLPQNASTPGRDSLTEKEQQQQRLLDKKGQPGYKSEYDTNNIVGEDYPSVREPWRMCVETGPERWRPSVQPRIQLRYTSVALPRGFRRDAADVASAMSMPLDEAYTTHQSENNKSVSDGQPRANQTLTVHMNDSSRVYYLSGYGIRAGLRLRFGARCTLSVAEMQAAMAKAGTRLYNTSELLLAMQGVHNAFLYERPLRIENDDGLFVLPREHLTEMQEPVAMCYASDEQGLHYVQSTLLLQVLPSQLRPKDYLRTDTHVLEHILARTLLVPQGSAACVNVSDLLQQAAKKGEDEQSNNNDKGEVYVHELAVGSRVLLARNCRRARPHGPVIPVTQRNTLNLTKTHTLGSCAGQTLSVCVQPAHTDSSNNSKEDDVQTEGPIDEEEIWHESADNDEGDNSESGQRDLSRAGYRASGVFVRIVRVQLEAVTRHTPPPHTREAGLSVVQRSHAGHGALLTVHFAHTLSPSTSSSQLQQHGNTLRTQQQSSPPLDTNTAAAVEDDDDMMAAETVLQDLDTPAALVFFGLVQLRADMHCAEATTFTSSLVARVRSDVVLRGVYNSTGLYISENKGEDSVGCNVSCGAHWYALLPLEEGEVHNNDEAMHARQQSVQGARTASLCLSVDGGRHFYSVDQSHVLLVPHAATLAIQNERNSRSSGADREIRAYAGGSWAASFYDTRYTPVTVNGSRSSSAEDRTAVLLRALVRDVLWSGNVYNVYHHQQQQQEEYNASSALTQTRRVGFMSDGILYLVPAYAQELTSELSDQTNPVFSGDLVLQQTTSDEELSAATTTTVIVRPTGLQLHIHLPYLRCVRSFDGTRGKWYVRRSNAGQLLTLETTSELCTGGLVPGMRLLATRITTAYTSTSESDAEDIEGERNRTQNMNAAPVRFVLSVLSIHTRETWPFAAPHLGLQLPASLSHYDTGGDVSDTYALCIMTDTPATFSSNTTSSFLQSTANDTRACLPTTVELIVVDDTTTTITNTTTNNDDEVLRVYSLNGQTRQVRVGQGSHTSLSVDGPVAGLGEGAVRLALLPLHTSEAYNSNTTNSTMYEALCANVTTHEGQEDDDAAVRWFVLSDNELRLPAAFTTPQYKRTSNNDTSDGVWPAQKYVVCYSVDFGLRFRPVAAASLMLFVDPPSVTGLTYTSAAQSYKFVQDKEGGEGDDVVVRVNTSVTSRTAAQLYRFARTSTPDNCSSNTSNTTVCDVYEAEDVVQTWQVTQPVHSSKDAEQPQHHRVRSRAAMYYYYDYTSNTNASSNSSTEDIFAQHSADALPSTNKQNVHARRPMRLMRLTGSAVDYYGRSWPSPLLTSTRKDSVKEIPTVVAAVAVLRSSQVGQRCNGYVLSANEANADIHTLRSLPSRALMLPVFLLSLQRGLPWSERDAERLEDAIEDMAEEDAVRAALEMNPVLRHTVWANNTRAMRTYDTETAEVSLVAFLHRALQHLTSESDGMDEALLVCLSVDGVRFHSPYNRTEIEEDEEEKVQVNEGDEDEEEEEACEAALPMYLRMDDTSHGSFCMRDVALTLYFTVTRNITHAHTDTGEDNNKGTSAHSLPCLVPSAKTMSRLHSTLAAQLGCDPVVLVLELQPVHTITGSITSSNNKYTNSSESSTVEGQGEEAEQTHYLFSLSVAADSIPLSSSPSTNNNNNVPKAAPDWLLEAVMLLRDNVTGPNIMRTLLSEVSAAAGQEGACVVELQTMNFTLSNGLDLHTVIFSSSSSSSSSSNDTSSIVAGNSCRSVHEPRWREALLAIPHRVSDPIPVPPVHLVSDVVWWLLVALVLASPLIVVAVVVAVHRRHARQRRRHGRVQVAQDVTLVPASTQ